MSSSTSLENVLILQGGGSLGAFGCGVFKALANNNVKLDIIAGTSIGGVNAAIKLEFNYLMLSEINSKT